MVLYDSGCGDKLQRRLSQVWTREYSECISAVIIKVDTLFPTVFLDVDVALFAEWFDDMCFE